LPNFRITVASPKSPVAGPPVPLKATEPQTGGHCRDARHRFRRPEIDRLRKRWAAKAAAASTAFPLAPSSAPLPGLERVGHRVRGLPGIEGLQRIDDVVVIDEIAVARSAGLDSIAHTSDAHDASTDRFSATVMSLLVTVL